MDSGPNGHLTSDLDCLSMHECYTGKDNVQVVNGSGLPISHIGHSLLPGSNCPLYLCNILHVPGLSKHLLSMQKLAHDNHAFVELHPSFFYVKDQATRRVEAAMGSTQCHALLHLRLRRPALRPTLVSPCLAICDTLDSGILHPALWSPSLGQINWHVRLVVCL
jgi:hypothetical protein